MIRAGINLVVCLGLLAGLLLAWTGLNLIVFDRQRLVTGVIGVVLGMVVWMLVLFVGRWMHAFAKGGVL